MAVRSAQATWNGTLKEGNGTMKVGSGFFEGPFTFASRFEEGKGTNPEELIAAAHSSCFSMAVSAELGKAGFKPTSIHTTATVYLGAGPTITKIELNTEADVPGLDEATFAEKAAAAKQGCPVSKALASVEIELTARLLA